jgi:hypothetical protein
MNNKNSNLLDLFMRDQMVNGTEQALRSTHESRLNAKLHFRRW